MNTPATHNGQWPVAELLREWPVFPCRPDKKPLTVHGFKDASHDDAQVEQWRREHPRCLWGVRTGSGLLVVDVDCKPDKPNGFETLSALEAEHGPLPTGPRARTPSGGVHLYFRTDAEIPSRNDALGAAIDIKCEGGYAIGYDAVEDAELEIPPPPEWLERLALEGPPRGTGEEWGEPEPLPTAPSVPPFPVDALPDSMRGWIVNTAGRVNGPVEFAAACALGAASGLIGRRMLLQTPVDDWREPAILWALLIGNSGEGKTPVLNSMMAPVKALEAESFARWNESLETFNQEKRRYDTRMKAATQAAQAAFKSGDAVKGNLLLDSLETEPQPPVCQQYMVSDSTQEALADCMKANPGGVLFVRDELAGTLKTFERAGYEQQRAFLIESYSGGSATINRRVRGRDFIPHCALAIVGGIQPEPLRELLTRTDADGLCARFQLAVWPDAPEPVSLNERPAADDAARARYHEAFERLGRLDEQGEAARLGGVWCERAESFVLEMNEEAAALFVEVVDKLNARRHDEYNAAMREHLAKAPATLARLALVLHCVGDWRGSVGLSTMEKAGALLDCFEAHARRMYSASNPTVEAAQRILTHLKETRADSVTRRELQRTLYRNAEAPPELDDALKLLCAYGWLRYNKQDRTGGKRVYEANPALLDEKE